MLFHTSDSSSSNVSTVSLGVSSELEFNHSWNRYDKRNNPKSINKTKKDNNKQTKNDNNDDKKKGGGGGREANQQTMLSEFSLDHFPEGVNSKLGNFQSSKQGHTRSKRDGNMKSFERLTHM